MLRVAIPLLACAALLGVLAFGYGTVPALGPALDPGRGVWTSASGGELPHSQALSLPGLGHPVQVSFTSHGVPSVRAASPHDVFLAEGYLQARFRLAQMDLERRLGEGRLAQLAGPSAVSSDKFELRLGLVRTAEREWAQMPRSSPAAQDLLAYSRGVNDDLAQLRRDRQWPALFSLAGVYPGGWTPVDSLVIQGDLTEQLDFTTTPLDYALLERALGAKRTMAWFPVLPPNEQHPYDPGPYRKAGLVPLQSGMSTSNSSATKTARRTPSPARAAAAVTAASVPAGRASRAGRVPAAEAAAASALLADVNALPAGQVHAYPDSNAWAANGPAVAGGRSMLAGDPHLPQTIPSIWYQVALSAPGYAVSGVSVPGLPGVLLGHNQHIAWSLTDTQNQATLFYTERTSRSRPGQYFWDGAWRRMRQVHYTIAVRGGAAQRLTVDLTVHGPVMTQAGQTTSVDWMGNVPSPDLAVLLAINTAHDWAQFHAALADWRAPSQNFVYADDRGHIGAISAGYYPVVRRGQPWLPMPGTGADDVAGVIPYAAVPQAYDPPGHVLATANQRPVGPSYPYYIGTTADFFDPGYRASQIYASLQNRQGIGPPRDDPGLVRGRADQPGRPAGRACPAQAAGRAAPARRGADRAAAAGRPAAGGLGRRDDGQVRGRLGVVDVLGRLPGRGLPAVVAHRGGPGAPGPGRAEGLARPGQPGRGAGDLDPARPGQRRVHRARGAAADRAAGDAGRVRHRGGPPVGPAGRRPVPLVLGPAAQQAVPVPDPGRRARLRPPRGGRGSVDRGRRRRRAGGHPGAQLADDHGVDRPRLRDSAGHLPRRPE